MQEAFDKYAPTLTASAARKALEESGIAASAITHMVSVTATNSKCPGYDHLVAKELGGIPVSAERSLIAGSGCAGGLAALRVANNMACASTLHHRPARILVVACELSSLSLRAELEAASRSGKLRIGAALFSDGAAAVVLCNDLALAESEKIPRLFTVADWCQHVAPDTYNEVAVDTGSHGFLVYLSKHLPKHAAAAVHVPLQRLFTAGRKRLPPPETCDWALHAGGAAIIKGVQKSVGIPDDKLRATSEIYRTRGNTASVTVLAVLDKLRAMGPGTRDVVMCSFGPGLTVEMALLERHC